MGRNSKVTYVKVLIGHESFALEKPLPNNHRFRWILFVRPIVGSKFTDTTFINKVEIELHPTFANPFRVLKEPPFELEETGYASFTPTLTIHFNTPRAKPYPVQYDLNLTLEKHSIHQQEMTFAMSDVAPSFLELVRLFCGSTDGKRKKRDTDTASNRPKKSKADDKIVCSDRSAKGSMNNDKKKHRDVKNEKVKEKKSKGPYVESNDGTDKKMAPICEASPSFGTVDTSAFRVAVAPQRPVKVAPSKAEERIISSDSSTACDSSSLSSSSLGTSSPPSRRTLPLPELHRRLISLTDENLIFRVAEILLTHPTASTSLFPSKPSISFDLTSADTALVAKLSQVLTG
ncbi:hypothetical protein KIN20_006763 [Parelaphostrongylus tenuis]|uniref:YEATS domain-containing protein n=1 Tax=Parelaphostrongylus tenuis TaxID=148309 RepID=A0AAD5QJI8_PARTN|nr:hypothetical protein KIN20_006763 [Parelaphostrongylus tenuis]